MSEADYAKHWDKTIPFLWNEEYIESLNALLKEHNVKSILDCACGTGFPSLDLATRGYNLQCSDGDDRMLELFRQNAEKRGVAIEPRCLLWTELHQIDGQFDCVMLRGNSLVYCASWADQDGRFDPQKADIGIQQSLAAVFRKVRPGGFLYVDITNLREREGVRDFGERAEDGIHYALRMEASYDIGRSHRILHSTLTRNGVVEERIYNSYFLPHARLVQLLHDAGFSRVEQYRPVNGETSYSVFLAYRD